MARKSHADTVRTCMMAGASMSLLFTAVSAYAVTAHQPAPQPMRPMFNEYLRTTDGLNALRQDLMKRQAQGHNAGALLAWMQQGGFQCEANLGVPGAYDCVYRRPLLFDRVAELQARILTQGTVLSEVTAPPPANARRDAQQNTAQINSSLSGS